MVNSILETIGNTPLLRLPFDVPAQVYAKLEYYNPTGSVKDRAALYMIEKAEKKGLLKPGGTIIEASSGNQGISAAMIGAIKGYRVIITASEKVSPDKLKAIQAYGAEVLVYPGTMLLNDPNSYHSKAWELHCKIPNSFMLNQYFNLDNREAHYNQTGPEIWRQTEGKITHFCAAAGSGGTIAGAGTFLKEQNAHITVMGIDAKNSYRSTQGKPQPYKIEGFGIDYDTPLLHNVSIDGFLTVTDDQAAEMLRTLTSYGLLVGPTSAAAAYAVREYARSLKPDDVVVTLFTDSGRAYLNKPYVQEILFEQPHLVNSIKKELSL